MKPRLQNAVIDAIDPAQAGRHNGDLAASTQRVLRGGTWKKQRIAVIIPAAESIPSRVYLSHCSLIFPPNQGVHRHLALGEEVGQAYSKAIEDILAHPELSQWEYLLTMEHDNAPPSDGVLKLVARMEEHPELAAISGLYWCKGEGGGLPGGVGTPHIWGDVNDPVVNFRPQPPRPGELVECCGLSMGFALWRLPMFKDARLRRPWFKTLASKEGVGTQDLAFWGEARKYGYRCAVDCGVLVGHFDSNTDMMW
ncbi:MAG TPA: hypothetical protein VK797_23005 [Tepidisphaeraceae bacterium]|jgi:hypothetical protein|nr:hypothetical protein [Tepidisphaeraceae bacterium]